VPVTDPGHIEAFAANRNTGAAWRRAGFDARDQFAIGHKHEDMTEPSTRHEHRPFGESRPDLSGQIMTFLSRSRGVL
jgi:hypothetical protein